MKTRRRRRADRIRQQIEFYLTVIRNGEWTENTAIVKHLQISSRGKSSYNSINQNTLGQYCRHIENIEKKCIDMNHNKHTMYRLILEEE